MRLAPAQLFFGRLNKTRLPIADVLLHRNTISEEIVQGQMEKKRERQRYYFDKGAKELPSRELGDLVIFKKNGKEWNYGTIVGNFNDKSYIVKDHFENHYRRNRRFIAKTVNGGFTKGDLLFEENVRQDDVPGKRLLSCHGHRWAKETMAMEQEYVRWRNSRRPGPIRTIHRHQMHMRRLAAGV